MAAFLQRLMFQKKKIAIQYGIDSIDRIIGQATISAIHRFVKVLEAFYLSEGKWYTYILILSRPGIGQRFFVHPYDFTTLKKWKVSAMVLAPTSNHPRMTPSFGRRCSPWQSDARLLIDLSARTYIMESVGPWACEKIVAIKLKHMW